MRDNNFMLKCSPNALQCNLTQKARASAYKLIDCEEGAIAICFVPKHRNAELWLHGPQACTGDTVLGVNFIHSIYPGKTMTRRAGWRDDPDQKPIACGGRVMTTMAACMEAVEKHYGRCSDDLPDSAAIEGYRNRPGCMCFSILPYDEGTGMPLSEDPWLDVYVSIDGATDDENKWCVWQVHTVIASAASAASVITPTYDPAIPVANGLIHAKPEIIIC